MVNVVEDGIVGKVVGHEGLILYGQLLFKAVELLESHVPAERREVQHVAPKGVVGCQKMAVEAPDGHPIKDLGRVVAEQGSRRAFPGEDALAFGRGR